MSIDVVFAETCEHRARDAVAFRVDPLELERRDLEHRDLILGEVGEVARADERFPAARDIGFAFRPDLGHRLHRARIVLRFDRLLEGTDGIGSSSPLEVTQRVKQLEQLIREAEDQNKPLEVDPLRGRLFELFVTAEASNLVDEDGIATAFDLTIVETGPAGSACGANQVWPVPRCFISARDGACSNYLMSSAILMSE